MRSPNQAVKLAVSLQSVAMVGQVVRSLCRANACGTVVMRFERCAYLQFNKQLVCFGLNELGASSITGLFDHTVHTLPHGLIVGATVHLSTEYLLIDDQYFFDLRESLSYVSVLQHKLSCLAVPATQFELLAKLTIPSVGFAPLLHHFTAACSEVDLTSTVNTTSIESELLIFVKSSIVQLADQIRCNINGGVSKTDGSRFDSVLFQKLVGAGPGLTPSGDDFICGVFAALHIAGFSYVVTSLWGTINTVAEQSTTSVSFTLLEQSALGESGERIDEVIKAYYDYPTISANDFQHRVELIGETSGWDWLSGFVLCSDILWRDQIKVSGSIDLTN